MIIVKNRNKKPISYFKMLLTFIIINILKKSNVVAVVVYRRNCVKIFSILLISREENEDYVCMK